MTRKKWDKIKSISGKTPEIDFTTQPDLLTCRSWAWFMKNVKNIRKKTYSADVVSLTNFVKILQERPEIMEKNPGRKLFLKDLCPKSVSTVPERGKCRIILTKNTLKEVVLVWEQFQRVKDIHWYERTDGTVRNFNNITLEDYLGVARESIMGPFDFRPREEI